MLSPIGTAERRERMHELIDFLHGLACNKLEEFNNCNHECFSQINIHCSADLNALYRSIYALQFDVPLDKTSLRQLANMYHHEFRGNTEEAYKESAAMIEKVISLFHEQDKL